ncbi:hypothetical protein NAS141_18099 [Sulfitobacter sp. NAS-14.1]|nr:hypothetical protein NAS141_18099 [Sulfitobacter sp. NAS-14.1]
MPVDVRGFAVSEKANARLMVSPFPDPRALG